jgi:hypothetical protein
MTSGTGDYGKRIAVLTCKEAEFGLQSARNTTLEI